MPEDYRMLQAALVSRPDLGDIIIGSGGLRKVRWKSQGRGKRGGTRAIYYLAAKLDQILMLLIYEKSRQDDLRPEQLKVLKRIVKEEFK